MSRFTNDADVGAELLRRWGSGEEPVPDTFWDAARPAEILQIGQAAREAGQGDVLEAAAQCAFTQTMSTPNDVEREAFSKVFAAIDPDRPGNAGLQA